MQRFALFTPDRLHRHVLGRRWAPGPNVCFIGLNPSAADEETDDPTIRRCVRFAQDWGYSALIMVNLFSLRATDPRQLEHGFASSGWNAACVAGRVRAAGMVVAAWGANEFAARYVKSGGLGAMGLSDHSLGWYCLGRTKDGMPKHPLYIRADTKPEIWLTDPAQRPPVGVQ